jgi:hypothetical protein
VQSPWARWKGLKGIGVAIGETIRDGKVVSDVRYYIRAIAPYWVIWYG